jgi:hypothetical protein
LQTLPDLQGFGTAEEQVTGHVDALHIEPFELRKYDLERHEISVHVGKKRDRRGFRRMCHGGILAPLALVGLPDVDACTDTWRAYSQVGDSVERGQ